MPTIAIVVALLVVVFFLLVTSSVRIVQEYERGVIFRLGRLVGARGPGFFLRIPGAERMQKIELRIVTHEGPAQEAIPATTSLLK